LFSQSDFLKIETTDRVGVMAALGYFVENEPSSTSLGDSASSDNSATSATRASSDGSSAPSPQLAMTAREKQQLIREMANAVMQQQNEQVGPLGCARSPLLSFCLF
jgi:hypothetical protein